MRKLQRSRTGTGHVVSTNALLLHHLQLRLGTPQIQVKVPHTLICSRGKIVTWLFTSKDDVVLSKHKKHLHLSRFVATAVQLARQRKTKIVCVAKSYLEAEARFRVEYLSEIQLLDLLETCKVHLPSGLVSLQAYVSRQNHNLTYLSSFSTTKYSSTGGVYSRRLVISKRKLGATSLVEAEYETKLRRLLSSEQRKQQIHCKHKEAFISVGTLVKERLSFITKLLVCYLEKKHGRSIHSLNVEYVQDEEGAFNLTHIWKVVSSKVSSTATKDIHERCDKDKVKVATHHPETRVKERLHHFLQEPGRKDQRKHPRCWGQFCALGRIDAEQQLHNRTLLKSILFGHLQHIEVNVQSSEGRSQCKAGVLSMTGSPNLEVLIKGSTESGWKLPQDISLQELTSSVPVCATCFAIYGVVEARAIKNSHAYVSSGRHEGIRVGRDLRVSNPSSKREHTRGQKKGTNGDLTKLSCSASDGRNMNNPARANEKRKPRASAGTSTNLRRDRLYNRLSSALHCDQSPPLLPLRTGSYYH